MKLQQYDVGVALKIRLLGADGKALSPAIAPGQYQQIEMWLRDPEGRVHKRDAVMLVDNVVQYVTRHGDIHRWGTWSAQAFLANDVSQIHTAVVPFEVGQNLTPPEIVLRPLPVSMLGEPRAPGVA